MRQKASAQQQLCKSWADELNLNHKIQKVMVRVTALSMSNKTKLKDQQNKDEKGSKIQAIYQ